MWYVYLLAVMSLSAWPKHGHDLRNTNFQNIGTGKMSTAPIFKTARLNTLTAKSGGVLADINGDGYLETILGTYNAQSMVNFEGRVYAIDHNGSDLWNYAPTSPWEGVSSAPAVGDINGDGDLEIVFGSWDGKIYALDHDGNCLWSYSTPTGDKIESSPAITDIDNNNGPLEIVFGSDDNNVYVLNANGSFRWTYATGGDVESSPAIADIDNNNTALEIVVGSYDNNVYVLNANGSCRWNYATGDKVRFSPAITDIDNNNSTLEIVAGSDDNKVYLLNTNGSCRWSYTTGNRIISSPAIANIDNNPYDEIIFASGTQIYSLYHDGSFKWTYALTGIATTSLSITVANINDLTPNPEIIISLDPFVALKYCLLCLNYDGSFLWETAYTLSIGTTIHELAIGDIDNDGDLEIALPGSYSNTFGLFIFDDKLDPLFTSGWFNQQPDFGSNNQIIRAVSENYAVGDKGLILKKDAYSKWTPVTGCGNDWDFYGVCETQDYAYVVGTNVKVSTDITYTGVRGIIAKLEKTGGGQSFLYSDNIVGADNNNLAFYCVDFANDQVGYIGASGGYVLKSVDFGQTWKANITTKPVPNTPEHFSDCVRGIWVDKNNLLGNNVWITTDNRGCVAQTKNGGITWTKWNETTAASFNTFRNDEPGHNPYPWGWGQSDWVNAPVNWADVRHANFGITGSGGAIDDAIMGISTGGVGASSGSAWNSTSVDINFDGRIMYPTWFTDVKYGSIGGGEKGTFYVGTSDAIYKTYAEWEHEYFLKNNDLYCVCSNGEKGWMAYSGGRRPNIDVEEGTLLGRYYAPLLGNIWAEGYEGGVSIGWITGEETWTSGVSDKITKYIVYRSICEEGPFEEVPGSVINATNNGFNFYGYTDNTVCFNIPYWYKVKVIWDDGGENRAQFWIGPAKSRPWGLMPITNRPIAPSVMSRIPYPIDHGEKSGFISWNSVPYALEYYIYRSEVSSNGDYEYIGNTSGLNYQDFTGEVGRDYYYAIRAVNAVGTNEIPSEPASFSETPPPSGSFVKTGANNILKPPQVTGVSFFRGRGGIIRCVWDATPFTEAGTGESNHEPYLGGYFVSASNSPNTFNLATTFSPIQRTWYEWAPVDWMYYYAVCAIDRSGNIGPWSTPVPYITYKSVKYVNCNGGNDGNSGTETSPWATIQKAANTLQPGEAVIVKGGTYHETVTPQNAGDPDDGRIVYLAAEGERVVITGDNTRDYGFNVSNKQYITIRGFEIENCKQAGILYDNSPYGEVWKSTIHHNRIGIKAYNSSLLGRENTIVANDSIGVFTNTGTGINFGNATYSNAEYNPGNNNIYANGLWNFVNTSGDTIIAQNNYWENSDSATIAGTVSGYSTFMPIKTILPLDWKLQVKATSNFAEDISNYAGVLGEASDSCDEGYDIPKYSTPPSNYVHLYFPHSEWNHPLGDKFCQDVRETVDLTDSTMVWNFEVNTDKSNENITLNILPSDVPSGYGIYLLDLGNGATQNLRTNPNYVYNSGAGGVRHFQLSVGLGGTNHGGTDWVWTTDSTRLVSGRHYNINLFKINSGATMNSVAFNGTDSTTGIIDVEAQTMQLLGTLSSTGKGNPKASGPGKGTNGTNGAGAGGGACCGQGGLGETEISGGAAYPDTLSPMAYLGCGGGNGSSYSAWGGAGGGLIKLSTATLTLSGKIESNGTDGEAGGSSYAGGGGGAGSIWITCDSIAGSGIAETNGGNGAYRSTAQGGGGSAGRLQIDYRNSSFSGKLLASGGVGAGSIYPDKAQDGQSGIIKVAQSNGNVELLVSPVNTTIGSHDRLSFVNGASFSNVKFQLDSGDSVLGNASIIANEITVGSGAVISADKKGYLTSNGTGKGTNGLNGAGAGGAGYGNTGGNGESGISGGVAYGEADSLNPTSLGSGGGAGNNYTVAPGGSGGGRLKLSANVITIDGVVSVNGEAGYKYASGYAGGAGSGGSIFISCDSLKGEGNIEAKGNDGANNTQADGGGSAGGRIALIRNVETFTGNVLVTQGIGPDNATDGGEGKICRAELGSGGSQGTMSKPLVFKLYQNYPNPFRDRTTIQYSLPKTSKVSLKLYDLTGRCIKTLVDGEKVPGCYKETLESRNYPTGIYFAKFKAGEYKETKKLILMK
ncbi:MAG: PQQ-binding-like beta-propeller repeat protein [bacterium]|nr:PQQ-binding-like beta-propeller repeat protein [bacterium]